MSKQLASHQQRVVDEKRELDERREFLDAITNVTLHIENAQLTRYGGNYSRFEDLRAQQLALQQATYTRQQEKIAHLQKFIDRFKAKATKALEALAGMLAIVDDSQAVAGYHLNGELEPWEGFPEVEAARAAITALREALKAAPQPAAVEQEPVTWIANEWYKNTWWAKHR